MSNPEFAPGANSPQIRRKNSPLAFWQCCKVVTVLKQQQDAVLDLDQPRSRSVCYFSFLGDVLNSSRIARVFQHISHFFENTFSTFPRSLTENPLWLR